MPTHARAPPPVLVSGSGPGPGPGPGSGSLPSAVLFELGHADATVQTEPLQLFVGFGPDCLSWSAINSAPYSQLKTHQQQERNLPSEGDSLSLSQS